MRSSDEIRGEAVGDIILKLHAGLSVQDAEDRFEREVGHVSSSEIAEIEQSLIEYGMSPEEIRRLCNVHALLFESAPKDSAPGMICTPEEVLGHLEAHGFSVQRGGFRGMICQRGEEK